MQKRVARRIKCVEDKGDHVEKGGNFTDWNSIVLL